MENTLSIIKPDAVKRNLTGKINAIFEDAGFRIIAQKRIHLNKKQAEMFYEVHKDRSFFQELVEFMISGPVVVQVLRSNNAVERNREIMGATNPSEAAENTIRAQYATSIGENVVHGSDSAENAIKEIAFFFAEIEMLD